MREYLRVSGEADEFRKSWIAAVDKNHLIGAPYWPESFFQAVKDEMRKTDLAPMYVAFFQHGVSRELMQEVLDAYRERGREHFSGSQECFKLGAAMAAIQGEYEKLKLAETQAVFSKVCMTNTSRRLRPLVLAIWRNTQISKTSRTSRRMRCRDMAVLPSTRM